MRGHLASTFCNTAPYSQLSACFACASSVAPALPTQEAARAFSQAGSLSPRACSAPSGCSALPSSTLSATYLRCTGSHAATICRSGHTVQVQHARAGKLRQCAGCLFSTSMREGAPGRAHMSWSGSVARHASCPRLTSAISASACRPPPGAMCMRMLLLHIPVTKSNPATAVALFGFPH